MNEYELILDSTGKSVLKLKEKHKYEHTLDYPEKAFLAVKQLFDLGNKAEEYVLMICCNTKSKPIACFEIAHGTVNTALLQPREIFVRALLCGASSFFIFHNHPSQDVSPSQEDIQITKKIKEAADLIGIVFLDHIIVSNNAYYSMHHLIKSD